MSYINLSFNHFRAIQRWAAATGARATLDATTFQLEVRHRNRYFHLLPQFSASIDGRLCYVPTLVDDVRGFAGWRPYPPYSLELATDKLLFKKSFAEAGLRAPAMWPDAAHAEGDFVLKRSQGSFGVQLVGPFRFGRRFSADAAGAAQGEGTLFAEQFVAGSILKVWFWGQRPFFAHVEPYLEIVGDGERPIDELARARMDIAESEWPHSPDRAIAAASIDYQGARLEDVPAAGSRRWVDFRYGRAQRATPPTSRSDNALSSLGDVTTGQIADAGHHAAGVLREVLPAPVAFTLDGVVDAHGDVWWLEMNSNPAFPPEGYAEMFADLFA